MLSYMMCLLLPELRGFSAIVLALSSSSIKVVLYALGCMKDLFYHCWLIDCYTALLPIAFHSASQIPLQLPEIFGQEYFA